MKKHKSLFSTLKEDRGLTLLEVVVAMAITTTLVFSVGQIMRATTSGIKYSISKATSVSTSQLLSNSIKADIEDSDSIKVSRFVNGDYYSDIDTDECTTSVGVDQANAKLSAFPLFTAFYRDTKTSDAKFVSVSKLVGYEVRLDAKGLTGELWRVTCTTVIDPATNETSYQVNPGLSLLIMGGLSVPATITTNADATVSITSNWDLDSSILAKFALKCVKSDTAGTVVAVDACPVGIEIGKQTGQVNDVQALVMRIWDSSNGVKQDITASRRA
jgi:hypothetical protein